MWSCKSDMVTDGHRKLLENMKWVHEEEFLIRYHYGRNQVLLDAPNYDHNGT